MNIFKKKKTPKQVAESLRDTLSSISVISQGANDNSVSKNSLSSTLSDMDKENLKEVSKRLVDVRFMICGDTDNTPKKEDGVALAKLLIFDNSPLILMKNLSLFSHEAKNDAVHVLSYMIQSDLGGFVNKYLRQGNRSTQVMRLLVQLFADPSIALHCGSLLRDCLLYDFLAVTFLEPTCWIYDRFFDKYLVSDSFDLSSDAFATFRLSLMKHMNIVPPFLTEHYQHFFERFNKLLVSDQYVTQRQSLKLLGEILLDRKNHKVMIIYIGNKDNLKIIMNLMRVKSPAIQMEAFHVFKVFVANPKKSDEVARILSLNRDKLINYLLTLSGELEDDQFIEERNLLVTTLNKMEVPEKVAAKTPAKVNTTSTNVDKTAENIEKMKINEKGINSISASTDNEASAVNVPAPVPPTNSSD